MSADATRFLTRWSRLKRAGGEQVPAPAATTVPAPAAALPDPATLAFADDFRGYLQQGVEEGVRRLALKKLFHSAEFNVMDGLDIYIDDYSITEPIDEATLRLMQQARVMLFDGAEDAPATAPVAATASPAQEATPLAEDERHAA